MTAQAYFGRKLTLSQVRFYRERNFRVVLITNFNRNERRFTITAAKAVLDNNRGNLTQYRCIIYRIDDKRHGNLATCERPVSDRVRKAVQTVIVGLRRVHERTIRIQRDRSVLGLIGD